MQLIKITALYVVLLTSGNVLATEGGDNSSNSKSAIIKGIERVGDTVESKAFQYTIGAALTAIVGRAADYYMDMNGVFERDIVIDSSDKGNAFTRLFTKPDFKTLPVASYLDFDAKTMQLVSDFQNQNLLNAKENRPLLSALLYGPPGTGKTKTATLIASSYHYDVISGSSLAGLALDKAQQKLTQFFEKGKKNRPNNEKYVLIIDEAEYLLMNRKLPSISLKTEALLPLFLSLVDKGTHPNFFVMAITNRPEILDPAIDRRLPFTIKVPLPDAETRVANIRRYLEPFINHHTENPKLGVAIYDDARDLSAFAADTEGLSPSQIESAMENAKSKAKLRQRLSGAIIRDAIQQVAAKRS